MYCRTFDLHDGILRVFGDGREGSTTLERSIHMAQVKFHHGCHYGFVIVSLWFHYGCHLGVLLTLTIDRLAF